MQKTNLLKDENVLNLLINLVGEEGIPLVKLLLNKPLNEFQIAQKMNLEVNTTRSLLYKLYSKKIVSFIKKREKDRGWYIYTWTLHPDKIIQIIKSSLQKKIDELQEKNNNLSEVQEFICPRCDVKYSFEKAMENMFNCSICDSNLTAVNKEKEVANIKKEIKRLEESMERVESIKIPTPKLKKSTLKKKDMEKTAKKKEAKKKKPAKKTQKIKEKAEKTAKKKEAKKKKPAKKPKKPVKKTAKRKK